MSLFRNPDEHAANPPETWQAVKADARSWRLCTADGTVLDHFATKRDAVAAKQDGWVVRLYQKEGRWYAGEPVRGWKPYTPVPAP